jgi:DNA helicase-2/ATP-dependent DNA helicase PcrA
MKRDMYPTPSRFVSEIPEHLLNEVRSRPTVSQPLYSPESRTAAPVNGISVGQRVMHAKFGEGVVINLEGSGAHARVEVNFEYAGTKWLVMAYANLQPVG